MPLAADAAELDVTAAAEVMLLSDETDGDEAAVVEDEIAAVVDVVDELSSEVVGAKLFVLAAETCEPTADVMDVKIETASEMRTLSNALLDCPETQAVSPTSSHRVEDLMIWNQRGQQKIIMSWRYFGGDHSARRHSLHFNLSSNALEQGTRCPTSHI